MLIPIMNIKKMIKCQNKSPLMIKLHKKWYLTYQIQQFKKNKINILKKYNKAIFSMKTHK